MIGQNEKNVREKAAQDNILKDLDNLHYAQSDSFGKIRTINRMQIPGFRSAGNLLDIAQPSGWLTGAALSITKQTNCVALAYVRGDSIIPVFQYLQKSWENLLKAQIMRPNVDLPSLVAPFIHQDKEGILVDYQSNLYEHVSWCESLEEGDDCGFCHSCEVMMRVLNTVKTFKPEAYTRYPLLAQRFEGMVEKVKAKPPVPPLLPDTAHPVPPVEINEI